MTDVVAHLLFTVLLLMMADELFRRGGKWLGWAAFVALPLSLVPLWIHHGYAGDYAEVGLFPWVKLFSLLVGAAWLTSLRYTALGDSRWARAALFLMLPLNILEAATQDLFGGHMAHGLLVLTAGLLIVSLPHPLHAIQVDHALPHRDLHYVGMTRSWIAWYTLWNGAFVALNYPAIAARELAVLAAPFAVGMIEPRRWLQSRVYTLAIDLLLLATFSKTMIPVTDSSSWITPGRENAVSIACVVIGAVHAARFLLHRLGGIGNQARTSRCCPPGSASGTP